MKQLRDEYWVLTRDAETGQVALEFFDAEAIPSRQEARALIAEVEK
jgi:hypothetical protein